MSNDVKNPLQNISYTNKDFESIYPELLDLVKQLTYKWDPTISNESDPGVILIKLNALIADKCNYNIDKNILECFPLSVTQESNARQLFEQLGYYMHWYKSAVTDISMKWVDEDADTTFKIPAFTMVTDYENSLVYTLVGPSTGTDDSEFKVGDQYLSTKGTVLSWKAIEGIAIKYDINGNDTITTADLDSKNRLYFNTTDVAQNGIFICNTGKTNYSSWVQKDNLVVESTENTYYKFGITKDGNNCYIEFPEDAEKVIKEGINITYIKTTGSAGNIASQVIEKFYNDLTPEGSSVLLTTDNVKISNFSAAVNGVDAETINEAYKGYKRTVGTFNTIITLRDYINSILQSGLVSNCFVCDRTNDIQNSYKIMSVVNDINQSMTFVERDALDESKLTAFSLKLYLLQYVDEIYNINSTSAENIARYKKTFNMLNDSQEENVKAYIEDLKAIQHDYVDFDPTTTDAAHFCFFKNKYPITCRIVTQYSLTSTQADEVITNIKKELFNKLNAKEVDFGGEIDLDTVYEIIQNADERIKTVILDNINYTTYAVYFDGSEFNEIEISSEDTEPITTTTSNEALAITVNADTFKTKVGPKNYHIYLFQYNQNHHWVIGSTQVNLADYGITVTGTPEVDDTITANVSLKTQFRDEVFAKSILAGVTPFLVKDETFDYKLNQSLTQIVEGIQKISGNASITFRQDSSDPTSDVTEYTLRDNENIQFFSPNLIDETSYSNYVKFEYFINSKINANADYQLKQNEYIILYWKEDDTENSVYKYYVYGQGNIFRPSFDISAKTSQSGIIGITLVQGLRNIGTSQKPVLVADSKYNGNMSTALSNSIATLTSNQFILSGSKTISIKKINEVTVDSTRYCYWILNNEENGKYTLFTEDTAVPPAESSYKRILESGEYFIYANDALTDLIILGSGTELVRNTTVGTWQVTASDGTSVIENGISALQDLWFQIPVGSEITVTENQFITAGPGSTVRMQIKSVPNVYKIVPHYTGSLTDEKVHIDPYIWFASPAGTQVGTFGFVYNYDTPAYPASEYPDGVWISDSTVVDLEGYGITLEIPEGSLPVHGDTLQVTVYYNWFVTFNRTGYLSQFQLSDFSISYKAQGSEEYIFIEDMSLTDETRTGWDGRSLFTINASSVDSQILCANQSISYQLSTGTWHTLNGADPINNSNPVCIMTSSVINDATGEEMTTFTEDEYGVKHYLSLYNFKQYISHDAIRYADDGSVVFDFPEDVTSRQFTFSLPVGEYLFPFAVPSNIFEHLKLKLDGTFLHAVYDENLVDFTEPRTYYVYMNITQQTEHTMIIQLTGHLDNVTISLDNPYKYVKPESMSESYFREMFDLISEWDSANHSFNYTFQGDPDDVIDNPLEAKSFLNVNHIYNKFTICEMDTSNNSSIYIMGKK